MYDSPVKKANKLNLKAISDIPWAPRKMANHTLKIKMEIPIIPKIINIISRKLNFIN